MSYVNPKNPKGQTPVTPAAETAHLNWMGGPSYFLNNPLATLRMAAASCFFGEPQYYQHDATDKRSTRQRNAMSDLPLSDKTLAYLRETLNACDPQEWRALSPAALLENAIDKALDYSIPATLDLAARLRNEDHIRLTPQVILVRAANHPHAKGTGMIRSYAPGILKRTDDAVNGLAYQAAAYGKDAPIPQQLKRSWRDFVAGKDEYQLAKYQMKGHGVTLYSLCNLVHPKSEAVAKLMKGQLTLTGETWEAIISVEGSSRATWEKALPHMGHMALLRNLRNLSDAGVPSYLYLDKLIQGVKGGQQLPFRYLSAYKTLEGKASPAVLDALETCLEISYANAPHFAGRVMSLCDNSGSARGTMTSTMGTMAVAEIANLMAIVTGRVSDEGYVGIFGDDLKVLPVMKKASLFQMEKQADRIGNSIGGSTENGVWLFWHKAITERQHWDSVFVYSDMQAGHGGLYGLNDIPNDYIWSPHGGTYIDVPALINTYRQTVNPNVMVYLVQVAGYQDTLMPEFYDRTYILGGWSENILRFAKTMVDLQPKAQV